MRLEMAEINIENILTDKNPKRKMYNELQKMRKIKVWLLIKVYLLILFYST